MSDEMKPLTITSPGEATLWREIFNIYANAPNCLNASDAVCEADAFILAARARGIRDEVPAVPVEDAPKMTAVCINGVNRDMTVGMPLTYEWLLTELGEDHLSAVYKIAGISGILSAGRQVFVNPGLVINAIRTGDA